MRSRWPDGLVVAGLALAAVGIGYGHTRVMAGGLSISVAAGWLSIQRQQKAVLQQVLPPSSEDSSSNLNEGIDKIIDLCQRFHDLEGQQLRQRNTNFQEKDVQDALEKLLRQEFPNADIRREYPAPQPYSHNRRIDLLLVDHQCAIEVKLSCTNKNEIIEALVVDFEVYRSASYTFKTLVCFIYDPNGTFPNPRGLIRDLRGDRGAFRVEVVVSAPKHREPEIQQLHLV
ncbi:hypothetical protein RYO59_001606 [Thermosynechococcaceae cyanobacterium Okahandja]